MKKNRNGVNLYETAEVCDGFLRHDSTARVRAEAFADNDKLSLCGVTFRFVRFSEGAGGLRAFFVSSDGRGGGDGIEVFGKQNLE